MDTEMQQIPQPSAPIKKPFHKRPAGIVLMVVSVVVLVMLVAFGALVFRYYRAIVAGGHLPDLGQHQGFTQSEVLTDTARTDSDVALIDVASDDDPSLGPPDAPVTIVEFLDFECPFCLKMFPIIRELAAKYPEKIRYVVRDFPLSDLHPNAMLAAEAGACAHAQNRFWAYHDKMFQNQNELEKESLLEYAQQVGLNSEKFSKCLNDGDYKTEIQEDYQAGLQAGAVGTPTFFVNGYKFQGVIPMEVWEQLMQLAGGK